MTEKRNSLSPNNQYEKKLICNRKKTRSLFLFSCVKQGDDMAKLARSKSASISLKILERMINQNTFDEIAQGQLSLIVYREISYSICLLQILNIGKMQLMNIVNKKVVFYHYGFFNMNQQKNLLVQIWLGIHFIQIYLLFHLVHV